MHTGVQRNGFEMKLSKTRFASSAKKYYSPLDGLDRRNGHKTGIVFGDEMCYIL